MSSHDVKIRAKGLFVGGCFMCAVLYTGAIKAGVTGILKCDEAEYALYAHISKGIKRDCNFIDNQPSPFVFDIVAGKMIVIKKDLID